MKVDLKDPTYVRDLQKNLHSIFDTPQGQEVMHFLEVSCGFYHSVFDPQSRDNTLINDGRRQVVATIKTLLTFDAETIVNKAKDE